MKYTLVFAFLFFLFSAPAFCLAEGQGKHLQLFEEVVGFEDGEMVVDVADDEFQASADTAVSFIDLVEKIYGNLYEWDDKFTLVLHFDFVEEDLKSVLERAFDEAVAKNDYIAFSIVRYGMSYRSIANYAEVTFDVDFHTDINEEAEISDAVQQVLLDLQVWHKSPQEKVRAVHDWMVANVEYDLGKSRRSAHDALYGEKRTVCQGYVLLCFAMLSELNVETRIINGFAGKQGEHHAWNMVKVQGQWLHLDVTHDDPVIYSDNGRSDALDDAAKGEYFASLSEDPRHKYYLLTDEDLRRADPHRSW